MSTATPPPNPCLAAILLVIQSRSGPRLVFHYPPHPLQERSAKTDPRSSRDAASTTSTSDSDTDSSSTDNRSVTTEKQARANVGSKTTLTDEEDDDYHGSGKATADGGEWKPSWDPLLGLPVDGLVSLLAPTSRDWHQQMFDVGFNDLCYVGYPVFIREDGTWEKKKRAKTKKSSEEDTATTNDGDKKGDQTKEAAASKDKSTAKPDKPSELRMFNVVFVLNPPILEQTLRKAEMYDNVVKPFSKALKFEQARQDYVWTECELLSTIMAKHMAKKSPTGTVYKELLSSSSLAQAMCTIYSSTGSGLIASVTLTPDISLALQIPPATFTSSLPSTIDPPAQLGIWLTTANDVPTSASDIDAGNVPSSSSAHLAKHFTLLLLEPPQKILKDISTAGGPIVGPLSRFVSACDPTKSFYKLSQTTSIPLAEMQTLARHLIYWRRGMAIPPLHQRDTYIVSPIADMSKLKSACKAYEAQFPTLPGLAKMLSALSGTPRAWGTLFPSPDHKETYMEILAFMLRGGWVTQLRNFAWVRVSPEVKQAVVEQEKAEEKDKEKDTAELEAYLEARQAHHDALAAKRPSLISRPSSSQQAKSKQEQEDDLGMSSLIMNPHRATPIESKYLDKIGETLLEETYSSIEMTDEERAQLKGCWPKFVKYFNGSEALEKIPVREGLKRKVVADVLTKLGLHTPGAGVGDDEEPKGKILVGVRHW